MTTSPSKDVSITSVGAQEWKSAQKYEQQTWVINNRRNSYPKIIYKFLRAIRHPKKLYNFIKFRDFYCGDDWNYWWMEKMDNYRSLPASLERALEVGSGPYTNLRLISQRVHIKEMFCTDPLMDVYKTFPLTWLTRMIAKGKVHATTGMCEKIEFPDNSFDLLVCNNVLDHVQDAKQGLAEMHRVLKPGGYFVFAQDLTNEEDLEFEREREGHPIRLHHEFLDGIFAPWYTDTFKRVLSREESRLPKVFYATYLYIGKKR